jgi:hypothetical protein
MADTRQTTTVERVDIMRLADDLADAGDGVDEATRKLMIPAGLIDGHRLHALSDLWRLSGRLQGMADALRIVEGSRNAD